MAGRDFSAELFGGPAKPGVGRDLSAELFGAQPKEESGFLRQAADVPLSVGKGALTGVRLIADAFGAGSKASEAIKGAEGYLSGLMSAQAKGDEQEIARIMKDAEDKGALEQVKAGLKAFSVAPVDLISQGLGTAAPAVLGLLGGKVLGAGALGARAIGAGIGATMGAGTAKGGIYQATKEELIKAGLPEDQAEKRAQEAQAYGGKNLDQILLSTGLGAFASSTGLESATRRILLRSGAQQAAKKEAADVARRGALQTGKTIAKGAAAEAAPEFIQAGQEQVAQNIALQREGFDVPTFRGAVGAGTLEALAGAGLGAGFGALETSKAGLREKAKQDAAAILEQERAIAGEEPPRTQPAQAPAEVSDIEELERQFGMAPPSAEAEAEAAVAETTEPAAEPAAEPTTEPAAIEAQAEAEPSVEAVVDREAQDAEAAAARADEEALTEIDRPRSIAEEMEGVPAPRLAEVESEVERLTKDQEAAAAERTKLEKRTAGTSLMQVLKGTLNDGELSELGGRARKVGKNPFLNLKASKGQTGSSMEDMVDSGRLDIFLPENMRPDHPDYVNSESAEYIRDKLRNNQFYTYETELAIERVNQDIEAIERQIQDLLTEEEINKEIQDAVNEQRELDEAAAEPAPAEEAGVAEERAGEEEILTAQTEEDLRAKEEAEAAAEKARKAEEKAKEEKAKADEAAADFVLTGSDREADEAAARGQSSMFSAEKGQTGYSPDPEDQRIEKELTGKTMLQAADWAVQNAPNAFSKVIAEKVRNRLRELQRKGVELEFKVEGGNTRSARMSGARGMTISNWGDKELGTKTKFSVTLNGAAVLENQAGYPPGTRYTTLLHELIHVATMGQLQFTPFSDPIRKQLRELSNAIVARFNEDAKAGKLPPVMQKYYKRENNVLRDDDEVMAWGLTDGEVQKYYADIKVGEKSAMSKLVDLVRQILGLGKPYESALDRLVTVSESLLDADIDTIEAVLGKSGRTLGEAKAAPAKGEQQSLFEQEGGAPKGRQNILGKPVLPAGSMPPGEGYELANWTLQPDTKLDTKDSVIYKLLDKNIDLKRVVNAIRGTVGDLGTRWNPYLQEELYHGRTAKQTKDFMSDEMSPLIKEMDEAGVTIGELEQYLQNRHAEAYNKHVAKVNPNKADMQDGGSGIKTEDAREYLDRLPEDKRKLYEKLAKRIDSITKGTRELLVKSGLEKRETIDNWEKTFPDYVPLMREEDDFEYTTGSFGVGRGYDVRGPSSKAAMGSKKKVVDILANVALARERAIVRAEKNRVAQALYGLALQAPNPNFWLAINPTAEKVPDSAIEELRDMGLDEGLVKFLMKEPRQRALDPKRNEVVERINTALRNNDNVLSTRINGENRYVFFNPNNDRAKRAATALKNLDAQDLGFFLGIMSKVTRFMASMNTQYNPIFGAYNFLRDVQGATLQLSTTPLAGKQKQVMSNVMPAMGAIFQSLRKEGKGEKVDTEMGRLWEDFQKAGGQTGFRDMYSRSQDRAKAIISEFEKIKQGKLRKGFSATFKLLSDYNDTMENAVRLAAYKVALDEGKNKDEAASIAKNLTVNFNRKGDIAMQAGAMYAFFNAAMQGSARLYETLRGPLGKKIIAGGLLWGVIQSSLLAMAGFDEEEPPEFVRERNFIIPTGWLTGNDDYVAFPMPLGYHVIPGFSRQITDAVFAAMGVTKSDKTPVERVAEMTGMFLEAFNPIGNAGWSLQTIMPTPFDPFVALGENRDWTGKKIYREDITSMRPTPGYTRAKDSANFVSTKLAEYMNLASGGTAYQKGLISPTPEHLEFLLGQALGGVGREGLKFAQTIEKGYTGKELPPYKIPLIGRFYGETKSSAAESNRFYKNLERLNSLKAEIDGRKKDRVPLGDFLQENPEARLATRANEIYSDVKKLRERREKLVERDAPRESVKAVETQITNKMRLLNEQVDRLKK